MRASNLALVQPRSREVHREQITPEARRCRKKFLRFFPRGFEDETYVAWERDYKSSANREWGRMLNQVGPRFNPYRAQCNLCIVAFAQQRRVRGLVQHSVPLAVGIPFVITLPREVGFILEAAGEKTQKLSPASPGLRRNLCWMNRSWAWLD